MKNSFTLETLVDFVDDALSTPQTMTTAHVEHFMADMKKHGVTRVIWGYYGDGHGGWFAPGSIEAYAADGRIDADQNFWGACLRTYQAMGNPLKVAVEAAHRQGIEVYAYYKPYETGPACAFPEGSIEAQEWGRLYQIGGYTTWLDPFVVQNPHLRIQRRTDDLFAGHETATITAIKLYKKDAAPTRIKQSNIQVWVSENNHGYRRATGKFTFADAVEPSPREVRDTYGNVVTKKGDAVRVLTLGGLKLDDRYVAVTTDFADGSPDFENAWDRLLVAFDGEGREIPGVYATASAVWFPELERFPGGGLVFDTGRGPEVLALDVPRAGSAHKPESSKHDIPGFERVRGVVAFARGRNPHHSGALCETEPTVQDYWLRCVKECLDAGVDGVEFRVENHSCHTDYPGDYGFNPAVMSRVAPDTADLLGDITRVRTAAYTEFLVKAKALIASRGKRMRVNLNVDWFRPPHERPGSRKIAYPANIDFAWREWLDRGLLDEAMLRIFAKPFEGIFGDDATAHEMVTRCRDRKVPVTVNRYIWNNAGARAEMERVHADGRFAGFVLYETCSFTGVSEGGRWSFADAKLDGKLAEKSPTWKTRLATAEYVRETCAAFRAMGK